MRYHNKYTNKCKSNYEGINNLYSDNCVIFQMRLIDYDHLECCDFFQGKYNNE